MKCKNLKWGLPVTVLALGLTAALCLCVGCRRADPPGARQGEAASPSEARAPAPAWELRDVNGKTVKLSDFKGKVVILDFWATWCPPCKLEIPGFVDLQKRYGEKGLAVVGVSLDDGGPGVVKPFMKRFGINYPIVMANPKVLQDYGGIEAIPTTFVIDPEGKIVVRHIGYTDKQEFEKAIEPFLKS